MSFAGRPLFRSAVVVAGVGLYGLTTYYSYHVFKSSKQLKAGHDDTMKNSTEVPDSDERSKQYTRIAHCYDSAIGMDEFFMGINLLRSVLLSYHAKGTVVEVAAGTGRNIPFYNSRQVQRVLLVDRSATMLEQAQEKIDKLKGDSTSPQFAVKQGDSESLSFCPSDSFDTVVDTFGLCSYEDPVTVLREMARICKKPNGKILLLEHGRSKSWSWVTRHLDHHQVDHAQKWGCVWNRDLDAILDKAGDALRVEILSRYHFGTTYYVVCQPVADDP